MIHSRSFARSFALLTVLAAVSPAIAETMSFEKATTMLAESCGKDIDANCLGVNLDAPRLKECLSRNQDSVSAQCRADYFKAFEAIQKRAAARNAVARNCEREKQKLCVEAQGRPGDLIACLLTAPPRGVSFRCNQAIGEAGYR